MTLFLIVLSIAMVAGIIAQFKGWQHVWLLVVIGTVAGYFPNLWLQIIVVIGLVVLYYWKRSDNSGDAARLLMMISVIVGLVIGNLIYYVPMTHINFNFQMDWKPSVDWFFR